MEIGALLLLLAVLTLVVLFVARPFPPRLLRTVKQDQKTSALLAEREQILDAVQELDFDNSLGKIPSGEYEGQRSLLLQKGAAVLRQLDERNGIRATSAETRLEAEIASRRPDAGSKRSQLLDEDLEDLIAKRRGARNQKARGFCPKCGKPVLASDRFCPSCGQLIS